MSQAAVPHPGLTIRGPTVLLSWCQSSRPFAKANWPGLFWHTSRVADPLRVWVFFDAQNVYRDARRAFHSDKGPSSFGQTKPWDVAQLLVSRAPENESRPRKLQEVRLYTGLPSNERQRKSYASHMKQRAAWLAAGVKVVPRPLRYPDDWPKTPAQEKGIDVALAIDFLFHAVRRDYDVGIVASTDTDLHPALEAVCEHHRAWGTPKVEVAAWASLSKRLRVTGVPIWCYWLDEADYEGVRDLTNYTL